MTDIFISYSRKDVEMVTILARTLEESGYSVWWDVSGLHGGQSFARVIQEKLAEAKCAIVVWSPDSVKSNWVHSEASFADNRGILVTAVYREAYAPMPFNNRHNENLRGWDGNVFDEGFQKLINAVHRHCPVPSGSVRPAEAISESSKEPKLDVSPTPQGFSKRSSKHSDGQGVSKGIKLIGIGLVAVAIAVGSYLLMPAQTNNLAIIEPLTKTVTEKPSLHPLVKAVTEPEATEVTTDFTKVGKLLADATEKVSTSKAYKLDNNLTLLPIPVGDFMMGSEDYLNEKPVHKVTFDNPFWMSKTEITFDQYDAYAKAVGKSLPDDENWGRGMRPVINISWNDTQDYVKWLSENNSQGLQCRLPRESEWEYAARAGSITKYPWGDTASHEKANYGSDDCCEGFAKGRDQWINTAPVGSFPENQWGLQDMHGNVWEWVQDPWHKDYHGAPANGGVWDKGGDEGRRVLRGGSWFFTPNDLRSAFRYRVTPDSRFDSVGFRVVCSPPSVS